MVGSPLTSNISPHHSEMWSPLPPTNLENGSELSNSSPSDTSFELKWNNYSSSLPSAFESMRKAEDFVDVTLTTSGLQDESSCNRYKAHRIVLSACSTYLRTILRDLPRWQHPVVMMPKDLPSRDLEDILTFIYWGKVHVDKDRLSSFLRSAEILQIKGLAAASAPKDNSLIEMNGNVQDNTDSSNRRTPSSINRAAKRSSPNIIQTNESCDLTSQSFSTLGVSDPKRSKFNSLSNTGNTGNLLTHQSSERLLNQNRATLQEMTEASNHLQSNFDVQVPMIQANRFEGSASAANPSFSTGPPSLLRIKEETSSSNSDSSNFGTNRGRISKSGGSFSTHQSVAEHVVIPTDPSLMQGLDSGCIEQDSFLEQTSTNQSLPSNQQISSVGLQITNKVDQATASSSSSGAKSKTQNINLKQLPNDANKSNDKEVSKQTGSSVSQTSANVSSTAVEPLVVLFSEKGRCHFCRLLCPDIQALRKHLETAHQPPKHALCDNCENFFHVCAIQRHKQKCTETYQKSEKMNNC